MGTLTTLDSGKLVAALAGVSPEGEAELVRPLTSEDGGQGWGHFSLVAYDKAHRWTAYNEMDITAFSDQLWVALPGDYAFPILIDNDALLATNQRSWGSFGVWRRIPAA